MWEEMQKIDTRHVLKPKKKSKRMYSSFIRTRGNMPAFLPSDGKISDRILEGNVSTQNYANCQSILLSRTFFFPRFHELDGCHGDKMSTVRNTCASKFQVEEPAVIYESSNFYRRRSSEKAEVCYFIIFIICLTSLEIKMDIS